MTSSVISPRIDLLRLSKLGHTFSDTESHKWSREIANG